MKYVSHTSYTLYCKSREEWYQRYFSESPRSTQYPAMAYGSAFDSFVKSALHDVFFGGPSIFDKMFTSAVEEYNRDMAHPVGKRVFEAYKKCGAFKSLCDMMRGCTELSLEGDDTQIISFGELSVPLRGKSDLTFRHRNGRKVVLDWKVNSIEKTISPQKGYVRSLPSGKSHKDQFCTVVDEILMGTTVLLENAKLEWAEQCAIYSWLSGEPVGGDFVACIDQIYGSELQVAQHRSRVSHDLQRDMFVTMSQIWDCVQTGHIFKDLSREESDKKCESLKDWLFSS